MTVTIGRRKFLAALGGAAATRPLAARAQQPAMPVIGFLSSASPGPYQPFLSAYHGGLKESRYIEGHNVAMEYRWAQGEYARLPTMADDLIRVRVSVIAAAGTPAALAARQRPRRCQLLSWSSMTLRSSDLSTV